MFARERMTRNTMAHHPPARGQNYHHLGFHPIRPVKARRVTARVLAEQQAHKQRREEGGHVNVRSLRRGTRLWADRHAHQQQRGTRDVRWGGPRGHRQLRMHPACDSGDAQCKQANPTKQRPLRPWPADFHQRGLTRLPHSRSRVAASQDPLQLSSPIEPYGLFIGQQLPTKRQLAAHYLSDDCTEATEPPRSKSSLYGRCFSSVGSSHSVVLDAAAPLASAFSGGDRCTIAVGFVQARASFLRVTQYLPSYSSCCPKVAPLSLVVVSPLRAWR